jgi:hypothetical protein
MRQYDWIVFFKGGSRKEYAECIRWASDLCKVPVALIGSHIMGEFKECIQLTRALNDGELPKQEQYRSLEIHRPSNTANILE